VTRAGARSAFSNMAGIGAILWTLVRPRDSLSDRRPPQPARRLICRQARLSPRTVAALENCRPGLEVHIHALVGFGRRR
jgi:hypothetical protein